jgi:hypothetical protein
MVSPNRKRHWAPLAAVAALLLAHLLIVNHALREKSATWDEPLWLWQGMSYWHGDFRFSAEGGSLPQRFATLPLLLDPGTHRIQEETGAGTTPRLDRYFPFRGDNDPAHILRLARLAMSFVSAGLCLAVFLVSRRLFGLRGGLLSLAVCAFSPVVLAHGGLVTVDAWSALFFLLATHAFALTMERLTWPRLAGLCLATAGLILGKTSAPLILPVWAGILLMRLLQPTAWTGRLGSRHLKPASTQAQVLARAFGILVVVGLCSWAAIWTAYGFRSAPLPTMTAADAQAHDAQFAAGMDALARKSPGLAKIARAAHRTGVLPDPFLHGFMRMASLLSRWSFLDGEMHLGGRLDYFPKCFLYKTPLPVIALLGTACLAMGLAGWSGIRRVQVGRLHPGQARRLLRRAFPYLVFVLIYGLFSITSPMNIGERHLLPLYAQAFVLIGVLARLPRWLPARRAAATSLIAASLLWLGTDAIRSHPHHLAYFNPIAGGPDNGYRHLVDSNLDWGQDYLGLKQWLEAHNPDGKELAYFLYFGDVSPTDLHVPAFPVESFQDRETRVYPLRPGLYAISATMLQYRPLGLDGYTPERYRECRDYLTPRLNADPKPDPRTPVSGLASIPGEISFLELYQFFHRWRCARLCDDLAGNASPVAMIGHSILIYRVSEDDLARALE